MNINLTDEPVCIPDEWNSTIRNCKAENSWEMNDKCRNEAEIPALPDHLKDLFERRSKNIANEETKRKLADMLIKNSKAFAGSKTDVGTCSFIKHRIDTAGAAPVRQPLRRTPIRFENEKFENLQDQLKTGVIKPSKSAWVSPVVLVRKKDNSVRWCVDFRRVNNLTIKDAYPIPRIVMCLDCLSSASIFLCLDLQSGYWQLMVEESDQPKTAFITKYGLYEYTKMPFGLCNAPSTFQRCMELIFRGLQWQTLLIYLDDIIIFSSDEKEHLKRLDEVFSRLINAGLKLKPSKCDLLREEILYLGHVVGKEGIKPNPKIVQSVDSWKAPSTAKEIQQFFVLCNYYRQYMYKFSDIAAPLSQLTRKDVPFEWTQPCQESLKKLKIALPTSPILEYPQTDGMFILDTDASNIGIGDVLSQIQENKEKVISYASKKLDRVQQRYSVTRRELLAVVTFLQQFRHCLLGRKFLLRTDHGSLRWIFAFKEPQGQLARWIESLSQYNFDIQHRPGTKHSNADAMSRNSNENDLCIHLKEGNLDSSCAECIEWKQEWSEFRKKVDNVKNLTDKPMIRNITQSSDGNCSSWLTKYTEKEMSTFQKEDPDYSFLHKWMDAEETPDRDKCASFSPAVRHYWLNWINLVRIGGVIYQKWREVKSMLDH
ncbi:Transposon Ty3-I Gag-Pol polyprotein,Transposon Ty3-G Gag-Pol polyprotein,Retrovirus-related Pol polyprotein from transposon 297 [Mytilus edulis]|uniref:Transposon Ty3-I Gag-Pol polyprotein,Transposon Ty3-G Gag-Pol polyprotein,Retrovirus-related Pol polyprotein from transposon 297 n=1 Tax=Mytilus edulis TaxID=6550 RepID=A0A8S3ULT4_MYTED|nr:Transposon Ty3-I Gag-Pol polyprotein,Transposon Ty3-G Gag-Pol polyprotein,Retrovirus-related Pol polyprotein from transposon 297 [Mytilus edulis]